jgi:hypothetical protein
MVLKDLEAPEIEEIEKAQTINKKCKKCIEGCKQWSFVTILQCPFYKKAALFLNTS